MSQFIVNCPGCQQPLQCEEAWAGQQIQCPSCQTALIVPGAAAPPPAPAAASRPSAQKGKGKAFTGKSKEKKGMSAQKGVLIVVFVVLGGVAGFFGFQGLMKLQSKMNAADKRERDLSGGGGQVAGIQDLNDFLDKTDPNNFSRLPAPERSGPDPDDMEGRGRGFGLGRPAVVMPTNDLPVLPPVYTLDIAAAKILESRANGKISGTNFVVETARLDPGTTSHPFRLRQGNPASPDVEVIIFLKLKAGESPAGKTWTVAKEDKSRDVASVTKLWKTNPRFAPKRKDFFTGYALKLELTAVSEGVLKAKIYLAMPDAEQSVVAGVFYAEAPAVTEAAVPTAAAAPESAPAPMTKAEMIRRR
jgi:hypothetical protein